MRPTTSPGGRPTNPHRPTSALRRGRSPPDSLPTAGITNERHLLYLARDLAHADRGDFAMRHEEAELERFWVPVGDLLAAVLEGRVQEGPLALSVLLYDAWRRQGRL